MKNIADKLPLNTRKYFINRRGYLGPHESVCRLMSLVSLLKKGVAIIYHQDKIATNGETIPAGADIMIRMADRAFTANIKTKIETNGNEFDL